MLHLVYGLAVVAAIAVAYGFYKYKTISGIEAEISKLDATASADAKALVAKIKSIL